MTRISLRLSFTEDEALGPGKIRLLELIAESGSISAAGRAMDMSYRRAWDLVDDLNRTFRKPLVSKQPGGTGGGGATLTPAGQEVVRLYRLIEANTVDNSRRHIAALESLRAPLNQKARSKRLKRIEK
jgi:molybdate transport system regulatory protein